MGLVKRGKKGAFFYFLFLFDCVKWWVDRVSRVEKGSGFSRLGYGLVNGLGRFSGSVGLFLMFLDLG